MKATDFYIRGINFGNQELLLPFRISVFDCVDEEKVLIKTEDPVVDPDLDATIYDNG